MTDQLQPHTTTVQVLQAVPGEVDAGTGITLKFGVACPEGCDLSGTLVQVLAQDDSVVGESPLVSFHDGTNDTGELRVNAPLALGATTWRVVFPEQPAGDMLHASGSTVLKITVKSHTTSIAVWDWPSPVVMNRPFDIKVGVKCSAGCALGGKAFEVIDEQGTRIGSGTLNDTPWPQTDALYWADAHLTAPTAEAVYAWSCRFPTAGLAVPHDEATKTFHFRTAAPPEHTVTVTVTDMDTKLPIERVQVLVHVFRTETDANGVAVLRVPTGRHEVHAAKDNYRMYELGANVTGDVAIAIEMIPDPY